MKSLETDLCIAIQNNPAISNMRYLKFRAISNLFPGPFSIYASFPYKVSRYLELRYLEIFAISNFSESVGHRNLLMKSFVCVRTLI